MVGTTPEGCDHVSGLIVEAFGAAFAVEAIAVEAISSFQNLPLFFAQIKLV